MLDGLVEDSRRRSVEGESGSKSVWRLQVMENWESFEGINQVRLKAETMERYEARLELW